jgi:Zn-dependent M16 (insulinase) family peptidase
LETPTVNRPPLERTVERVVEFPERDESVGELLLGFMGPPVEQHLERKVSSCSYASYSPYSNTIQALDILSTYLTSSSVAPLNKEFIETDNPLW